MKIKKWLATAAMLASMAAIFTPLSVSAASVPTDGTGTVIENTTADSSQREFFTIKTADGNVFYIVVDKTKTDDNVYLLTPVTEDSLKALAENAAQKNGTTAASGTSNILGSLSGSAGTSSASGTTTVSETGGGASASGSTATAQTAKTAASAGNIAFIVLAAIGVFAVAFYFKIYKPRHTAMPESLEEEPDEDDSGDSNEGDEDDEPEETEKPRKPAPSQGKPMENDQSAPEQARSELAQPGPKWEPSGDQPEMEEPEPAAQEPRAPASPRPRREDVWPESENSISGPEAQPEPTRSMQASTRARVGGLFAPDTPDTPEQEQGKAPQTSATGGTEEPVEPEPEEDENEMDYGDGMDAFGNPD